MVSQSHPIHFLTHLPITVSHRRFVHDHYSNSKIRRLRCFSGGSRWDWDNNVNPNRRSRFSDAYATDDYDEEVEYGSRNTAKQRRRWWSDDYDDDDEEDEGFGILEASIGFNWVVKVFRAFGWMIPVVAVSLLLGSGPNTIIMAVALPLAQSALSLAADTLWGTSDDTPRPKSNKSKKRRPPSRAKKQKEVHFRARREAGSYKSWVYENRMRGGQQKFGGWDELDKDKEPRVRQEADEPRVKERVKVSRRTQGETPLLIRLLIAMFPYLGFWTKIF